MDKIPEHKISDEHHGKIAFLKYISANSHNTMINYAHRDDYYLFIFMEKGRVRFLVDFEEYDIEGPMVHCVLPGQVHHVVDYSPDTESWVLIADNMLVSEESKETFGNASLIGNNIAPDEDIVRDLKYCVSMLDRRLNAEKQPAGQGVSHSLLTSCIGMIAEAYRKGSPVMPNKRYASITHRFKSLLSAGYTTMKSPSQYASALNISPAYLNEAVKKTTGLTVGECIRNEVVTQAKRLLFYTDMNVREIAAELGYEDWAYFTRLFTKAASLSPTRFRSKYLK